MTRTAVLLCAALGLTAAVGTASAAPSGSTARQVEVPVLVDCLWHPQVRPANFILACGDGNSRLVSLNWDSWGSKSAQATGVNVVNDCVPFCAAGKFHPYAVVVKLDHPQPWKKNPKLEHFGRMTLTYTGDRPDHFKRVVTFPLWQ